LIPNLIFTTVNVNLKVSEFHETHFLLCRVPNYYHPIKRQWCRSSGTTANHFSFVSAVSYVSKVTQPFKLSKAGREVWTWKNGNTFQIAVALFCGHFRNYLIFQFLRFYFFPCLLFYPFESSPIFWGSVGAVFTFVYKWPFAPTERKEPSKLFLFVFKILQFIR